MLTRRRWLTIASAAFGVPALGWTTQAMADGYTLMEIGELNATTHIAVQRALKEQGFYLGALDGKAGPATRRAIIALRRARRIPYRRPLALDVTLVNALFGIVDFHVETHEDEEELLVKLGLKPASRYSSEEKEL